MRKMKRGLVSRRVPERKLFFNKRVLILLLIVLAVAILFFLFKSPPPQILSASVYPEKITAGQAMQIKAEIKDSLLIKNAKAIIETDDLPDITRLLLVDGTIRNGKYERVWIAHDTSSQKWYNITITATNIFGKTASIIIPYQDPTQSHNASEIVGGTFTGNYTFAGGNVNVTSSMIMPVGTTAQRPASPTSGMVRFNTNTTKLEFYNGNLWRSSSSTMSATGGTITESGDYIIHTFTSSGTFTVTGSGNVEYLVVAGGGSGGGGVGGGGGAGGFRNGTLAVTSQAYTVTVGAGGVHGATEDTQGTSGSNSVFSSITSTGGGAGGWYGAGGLSGGSGGGGGRDQVGGAGTGGQGYAGGAETGTYNVGAGGGGASAVGADAPSSAGGNGGAGISSSINGTATYYAGGGGGGWYSEGSPGTGGAGGGGNGNLNNNEDGNAGTANSGGGGGGGSGNGHLGGDGGSGIVIIRYLQ